MTRKHFEAIAKVMSAWRGARDDESHRYLSLELAGVLKETNERFDRQRFLDACKGPLSYKENN